MPQTLTEPISVADSTMHDRLRTPTLHDVYRARHNVSAYLPPTPLINSERLSAKLGFDVYLKCENLQPIGAFKIRGGINLISQLTDDDRSRGVVCSSTGNHGQSIAYAARLFGIPAVIFVPEGANPVKVDSMRRLGAEVVFHGRDFDECVDEAENRARRDGMYSIHSANETMLIAGVGTYMLEILDEVSDVDTVIVPIGAGSGACGVITAGKGVNPDLEVIGVQAEGAPVVRDSWQQGELLSYEEMDTFAEGMATRVAFELPLRILKDGIDDIELVSDAEMKRAILTLLESQRLLAEGAGASALAAARKRRDTLKGKKVALIVSGGNLTLDSLRDAMAEEQPW